MNLQRQLDAFRRNQMAVQLASKAAAEKKAVAELAKQRKEQEAQLKAQQNAAAIQAVPVVQRAAGPPVMLVVKNVLDVLRRVCPDMLTAAEVLEHSGIDLMRDTEAARALAVNAKVRYEPPPTYGEHAGDASAAKYGFKSAFPEVTNAQQLAQLIVARPEGTSLQVLSECYPQAGEDARHLVDDGAAWLIANGETSDKMVFPRDKAYETCCVSDRVRGIWLRMEVPTDLGAVAAEMQRAGIPQAKRKPWERTAGDGGRSRGGGADGQPKKRRKRDFSKLHVTNVHLFDELLAPGAMADELDDDD